MQEIVDFAKQVPGFLDLGREDQIALLKASTIEVNGQPARPPLGPSRLPARSPGREPRDGCWERRASRPPPVLALVGMMFYRGVLQY